MTTLDTAPQPNPKPPRGTDPDATRFVVPGLGTIELSRPELVYLTGIAALGIFGLLDWPLALVIGAGHLLAADRSHRSARELGEAMKEAG